MVDTLQRAKSGKPIPIPNANAITSANSQTTLPVTAPHRTEAANETSSKPTTSRRTATRHKSTTFISDLFVMASAILSYLIALILYFYAPRTWRHRATFPILLSPPGAILRYLLSKLNQRKPFTGKFPIGTFVANMGASLIIAGMYVAQRRPVNGIGALRCNALYAVQQGFCGCLSTVSTFVVELRGMKRHRWKWIYGGGSVVLGHLLVMAVVGGYGWAKGVGVGLAPVCTG